MLRSRTTLLLLLLALFAFASTSASALQIRINSGMIAHDDGGLGFIAGSITPSTFIDFELDCASASECTVQDFWFGNSVTQNHFAMLGSFDFNRELRMQDAAGNLLDASYPHSNGTSNIVLTLGAGGLVTSDTQYVESFGVSPFGQDPTGEDFSFALSTDGSLFPRGGPSNNVGCADADVGSGFFDLVAAGVTLPSGSAMTDGFNLGSTGTLVAVGCYFRQEDAYEVPLLMTLNVEIVPEPSTALLLAGGLGGIAWFGRRRR